MLEVLGLDNLLEASEGPPPELVELAERRTEARSRRDFAEADRLRDEAARRRAGRSGTARRAGAAPCRRRGSLRAPAA